ncbi:MAG: ERF family protein [Candidatus Eisenbacteria sp.]|nr:ERF family protein [Candidatus Eisenbacteria bacterium]
MEEEKRIETALQRSGLQVHPPEELQLYGGLYLPMQHTSPSISKLTAALAGVQAKMKPATKDGYNPHHKSRYSTLSAIQAAAQEAGLGLAGLAIIQFFRVAPDGSNILITLLSHVSGEFASGELRIVPEKKRPKDRNGDFIRDKATGKILELSGKDPQGWVAASTYARKVGYSGMAGVAPGDDDDGETAAGRGTREEARDASGKRRGSQRPRGSGKPATAKPAPDAGDATATRYVKAAEDLLRDAGIPKQRRRTILSSLKLGTKELKAVDGATVFYEAVRDEAKAKGFDVKDWLAKRKEANGQG